MQLKFLKNKDDKTAGPQNTKEYTASDLKLRLWPRSKISIIYFHPL